MKDLVDKEANIWACIYRGINRKRENYEFDEEESEEELLYSATLQSNKFNLLPPDSYQRSSTEVTTPSSLVYVPQRTLIPGQKMAIIQEDNEEMQEDFHDEEELNHDNILEANNIVESDNEINNIPKPENLEKKSFSATLDPSSLSGRVGLKSMNRQSTAAIDKLSPISQTHVRMASLNRKSSVLLSQKSIARNFNPYASEEMLVIYYIAIVIRL